MEARRQRTLSLALRERAARWGWLVLAATALHAARVAAADAFPASPGLYVATRAEVTVAGRTCGIGTPLVPAFALHVVDPRSSPIVDAVAILRDDAGAAMPVAAQAGGAYALADLTEPPTSSTYRLGELAVIDVAPTLRVNVDYRRLDLDCRIAGTLHFERADDTAVAQQLDAIARALESAGRRDALRAAGKSREALEPAREAEAALQAALGRDHPLALNASTNIASLHWDLDEFVQSRERWNDAIARLTATLGGGHFHVLRARGNLALVLWDLGDLDDAEAILRDVATRYATLLDADDTHALGTLTNLATLLVQRGRYSEAERMLLDVGVRNERALGPDHPRTLVTLNNLANMLSGMGRHEDALAQYATVVERYQRSLGPRHPATLRARHNQASLLALLGRADAIAQLREVLDLRREAIGRLHSETLFTQNNLARYLATSGSLDEAIALQTEVAEAREAVGGAANIETLRAQTLLGQMELAAGKAELAIARMKRAYEIGLATLGSTDRIVLELGSKLGTAQRTAGDPRAARATLRGVVDDLEAWRESAATSATARREVFARWVASYKELAGLELALGDSAAAFEQAERSKARMLAETLALRRSESRDVLPADALAQLQRLDRSLSDAETEVARASQGSSERLAFDRRRAEIAEEARALRAALRERFPKYASLSRPRIVPHAEGARELPHNALFVSYLRDGDRVLAFVLRRDGRLRGVDLGDYAGLDDAVLAYRTLIAAVPGAPRVWRMPDGRYRMGLQREPGAVRVTEASRIGAELAKRLVEPLTELARAKRLIVSPDSALALLPFETLPFRGRPLVATHEISYAPSLTVYALTMRRGRDYDRLTDRAPLYAMGAALYGGATTSAASSSGVALASLAGALANDPVGVRRAYDALGLRWPDLPTSAEEIRTVAAHFRSAGEVTIRSVAQATEAQLIADDRAGTLARHRYVLLSAHGYLSTEAPSLSAVVLGQNDVSPDADGYVTAAEWTGYTLRSDLIVISACETGAGRVIEGEGVAGLPYALFVAGNRNALLTLWPVADASTARFVSRFFGHLRAGRSQSSALSLTKREFAASGRYTAPLYWAAFVLWGA